MKDMNKLRYSPDATTGENLFRFWLLFCQHVVFFQVLSFIYSVFVHPFPWIIIIGASTGGSIGWFLGPNYKITLFRHN